jgi:hypothetical protein
MQLSHSHCLGRVGGVRPGRLFAGIRALSTLGIFLRAFTFGHVRQLDSVATTVLANLARQSPLLTDADRSMLVDIDDTVKPTYGHAEQGAGPSLSTERTVSTADYAGRIIVINVWGSWGVPAAKRLPT